MKVRRGDGFRRDLFSTAELHPYSSESWWTAAGARKKERRLVRAGLPDFKNWRFVTLTIANRAISPKEAYFKGKDRIRRFLARFRNALGRQFHWCWKLEFHHDEGGYPHWHLLIEYTKRIPSEILSEIERWWGLGRTNVRRVNGSDIRYVFKYVTKHAEEVPEWVGRHKGRIRVFQASRGFYTRRKLKVREKKAPIKCAVPVDLITRLELDKKRGLIVMTDLLGNKRLRLVRLKDTFKERLLKSANESIRRRVQLAPPGVVNISQLEAKELMNEPK